MIHFTSKVAGEVQMLTAHGEQVLRAIGKPVEVRGVITPEQIPAALAALHNAINMDLDERRELLAGAIAKAKAEGEEEPTDHGVDLGRRAFPLIQMLERAAVANEPVLWGV
jgi:hypothetical protein